MKKLIIIPAYNESANIEKTIKMIQENAPEFDYVIINDCSTDDTKKICEKNGYNYSTILMREKDGFPKTQGNRRRSAAAV